MRAKFELQNVTQIAEDAEELRFVAVTEKPFDEEGNSEDNSFSRWTPTGELTMTITNPNLIGTMEPGEKYYLDFTKTEN